MKKLATMLMMLAGLGLATPALADDAPGKKPARTIKAKKKVRKKVVRKKVVKKKVRKKAAKKKAAK